MSSPVGPSDVLAAAGVLAAVVRRTPVLESRALSEAAGGPVLLKCENLQRAGSFKVRGAYLRMSRLSEAERARGVVAASAGNHAQGVALAARLLGVSATVFMPEGAALPKVAATADYGARVQLTGSTVEEALAAAREYSATTGAHLPVTVVPGPTMADGIAVACPGEVPFAVVRDTGTPCTRSPRRSSPAGSCIWLSGRRWLSSQPAARASPPC